MKTINKLTDLMIKAAIKEALAGKQTVKIRKLADGGGLYLWILADGTAYWRLRYWVAKKEKLMSLGVYPAVSLAKARADCVGYTVGKDRVEGKREQLRRGIDPSAQKQSDKRAKVLAGANTFEAIARAWHAEFSKEGRGWKPRHAQATLRLLEFNLFGDLGERPIKDITPPELLNCLRKIEARGANNTFHRALRVAGCVFKFAVAHGKCERDIAADVAGLGALVIHKVVPQPAVGGSELCGLLHAIDGYKGDRQTVLALQLLALTFVRTSELTGATWGEFDLANATWIIPAARMKKDRDHLVPLSAQSLAILDGLKKLPNTGDYLFPGRKSGQPMSMHTMLGALRRMGYANRQTGHGFRAIASTVLNGDSPWIERPDVIEMQLAHLTSGTRAAYNRAAYWSERVVMMQWYADYLDTVREGARVLPFGRAA